MQYIVTVNDVFKFNVKLYLEINITLVSLDSIELLIGYFH